MNTEHLHEWNVSAAEAIAIQKQLADRVVYDRPIDPAAVRLVAGVDVSVRTDRDGVAQSQAAIAVMTLPDFTVVETVRAQLPTPFPYIPGLLSFREAPVLLKAFALLEQVPDVFIFDGMGRAHPRRLGIASHMGLWLNAPTIGCGKTLLVGTHEPVGEDRGSFSLMRHRGDVIGAALRTRSRTKVVYISPGHLIDLDSSIALIMRCTPKYRLPEPIRAAHNAAGEF